MCVLHTSRTPREQEDGKAHGKQEEKPLTPAPSIVPNVMPANKGEMFLGSCSVVTSKAMKGSVELRGNNPLATVIKRLIVKLIFDSGQHWEEGK